MKSDQVDHDHHWPSGSKVFSCIIYIHSQGVLFAVESPECFLSKENSEMRKRCEDFSEELLEKTEMSEQALNEKTVIKFKERKLVIIYHNY